MFLAVLSSLILLTLTISNAFAGSAATDSYLSLKIKESVLKKEMASGETMLLPDFEVYDASGLRIYHSIGLPPDFQESVLAALDNGVQEDIYLKDRQSILVTADGSPSPNTAFSGADYVFIEYWAEWCSACLQQMEQVKQIIRNHPDRKIRWLKVEKDPMKLGAVPVKIHNKND
ncbi:hypothetical protein [Thiolapillus sp.]